MGGNKDFIEILREIRGTAVPGEPVTDGIWYELTIADIDGNPGIYGDILAKYGIFLDNVDNIQIITAIQAEIVAVAAIRDVVVAVAANEANINAVVVNSSNINSVAANEVNINAVAADIVDIAKVADDIIKVTTVSSNIADVVEVADNIGVVVEAIDKANEILVAREAMGEPTGFNRAVVAEMGILELAVTEQMLAVPPYTSYTVYRIDENRLSSKLTGQTVWGNGDLIDTTEAYLFSQYPVDAGNPTKWWYRGTQYTSVVRDEVIPTTVSGRHWFYRDGTAGLKHTASNSVDFSAQATVAVVYGNATTGEKVIFGDERHGIVMDGVTHNYLHSTQGAQYVSGLDINGLVEGVGTYTDVSAGQIKDEDISLDVVLSVNSTFLYLEGTVWKGVADANKVAHIVGGVAKRNLNIGGVYSLVDIGIAKYALVHFIGTNDSEYPIMKILGQQEYANKSAAETGSLTEVNSLVLDGLPSPEFVFLYTVIVDRDGNLIAQEDGSLFADWRASGVTTGGGSGSGSATVETAQVTLTAGQTEVPIIYTVGQVEVYYNGLKLLNTVDYTATTGTNIVLTAAANAGDLLETVVYSAFQVADVYTQGQTNALLALKADSTALAGKLDSTATATDATKWNGATMYTSTSAASGGVDGDIWFQY